MGFFRRYGSTNLASERGHPSGQIVVNVSEQYRKENPDFYKEF